MIIKISEDGGQIEAVRRPAMLLSIRLYVELVGELMTNRRFSAAAAAENTTSNGRVLG